MGTTFSSCFYDFPRIIMLYIIFFFVVCYFGFFLPDVKWCKCSLLCAYVYTGIKNFKEVIQLRHKYTLLPFVRLNYVSFAHRTFPQNKWYSIPKIVLYTFLLAHLFDDVSIIRWGQRQWNLQGFDIEYVFSVGGLLSRTFAV